MKRPNLSTNHGGFTLVELLVAFGLMLVLAGLAVGVSYSGIFSSYRTIGTADRVSSWLLIAKSKAIREGAPRGVRFIVDPTNPTQIREAQFIEMPTPYVPVSPVPTQAARVLIQHSTTAPATHRVFVTGPNMAAEFIANINPGDNLSLPDFKSLHRITAVSNPPIDANTVELAVADLNLLPDLAAAQNPSAPSFSTTSFGFLRQARPLLGEEVLQLGPDVVIDFRPGDFNLPSATSTSLLPLVNGELDILFAPNGEVLNTNLGLLVLWVRDPSKGPSPRANGDVREEYEANGDMALIAIYARTGMIATQPVNLPPNPGPNAGHDPYVFAKDGVNSGL